MSDTTSALRLQLLANGYTPLPNVGKTTYLRGWPDIEVTPEVIERWGKRNTRWPDTGIRVQDGLLVIDIDVDHELAPELLAALDERFERLPDALLRTGKGSKVALFARTSEPFSRIHTRRFTAPGENTEEHGTHVVEVFGGASPRQFGAFGAHTRDAAGEVVIAYTWDYGHDSSPLTVPLAELPEFSKAEIFELVDFCERWLMEHGFEPVVRTTKGESEAQRVYDLVEGLEFEDSEGRDTVPLADVRERAGDDGYRVSASFIEPGRGHSRTRCLVGRSHSGLLTIWDSATGITHMEPSASPEQAQERQTDTDALAAKLKRLAELEDEKKSKRRAKLSAEDDHLVAAAKLVQTWAYCRTQQLDVVPIWASSVDEGMTLAKFRNDMQPWCGVEIGPRGGEKRINPVDLWMASSERLSVEGLRMRPDMPRPVFEEHGKKWINTYTPELHEDEGGDPSGGIALMEQLSPDPRERAWHRQWLAYKWLHPDVPGPALLMVARAFGTGRGTYAELLKLMFGTRYINGIGFDHFAGRTYQSQYTEWQADSLIVIVNESSTADSGSQYRTKHDTYERLKEIVDPRAMERTIIAKNIKAHRAMVCASYLIFTNNPDALPLPAEDRRFAVLTNGEPRDPEFWEEINEWMRDRRNVAAFIRWLEATELSGYSPYDKPIDTMAKRGMADLNRSDLDRAFDEALELLPGELVVPEQVLAAIRKVRDLNSYDLPDRWEAAARKMVQRKLYKAGERDGAGEVVYIENKRYRVYAKSTRSAGGFDAKSTRIEVLRNGDPASNKDISAVLSRLKLVKSTRTPADHPHEKGD